MIGELAALGAALSWAVAPILYRKALCSTKPVSANIVRNATNAAVLAAVLLGFGLAGTLAGLPLWVVGVVVASAVLGLGIGDTLYLYGLKMLGMSRAVPLAASYPLFSLVWAVLFLRQQLLFTAVLGAAVILGGIWLLSSQKTVYETEIRGRAAWRGTAICLAAAFVWSVSITGMDTAVMSIKMDGLAANFAVVTVRIASIAIILLALAPLIDRDRGYLKMTRKTVLTLCVGGLIANGLGWVLMNISFQNIVASRAIPISSTSPLFAALAGFLFFREKATFKTIAGAVAVVAGIALIFFI